MAYAEKRGKTWRARYKRPDNTWGSEPGFETKTAAERWGEEQEALVRKHNWIDPHAGDVPFGEFADRWMSVNRFAINTEAKYRSHLRCHLLPQWEDWPLGAILHDHLEVQGWVNELHEDLAEWTVASVFATFSTIMNVAVRARKIPASPCQGIKVTSGLLEVEHQVATPTQFLRAALRMDDLMGYRGFVLTLLDGYTGARWSELISQRPGQYDPDDKSFPVRHPLREAGGRIQEAPRPKSPAGKRTIQLPPFLAGLYEPLVEHCRYKRVFTGARGGELRRSNFTRRFWRPAWDGDPADPDRPVPPILAGFTFHEGRHSHRTWLADDGLPDAVRAARLGHKLPGMANVYEHVTEEAKQRVLAALQARWEDSVRQLSDDERRHLLLVVPADLRKGITQRY